MDISTPIILFLLGFYILIKGAKFLVRGASSMARIFGLSNWFIGIVIVGIGTSIPELSINLASALNSQTIGLSTIIGSNTFNILVILGLSAIFVPITIQKQWVKDLWFNISIIIVATIFILLPVLGESTFEGISRPEAIILLAIFIAWIFFVLRRPEETESSEEEVFTILVSITMVIAGVVGVFFGGRWVINGAEFIARTLSLSQNFVGLTLVAIGTSLPELTVSLIATIKKKPGIAVGNIIGSNIFDFLGILGITALLKPLAVIGDFRFDILVALGAIIILLLAIRINNKYQISRFEGLIMLVLYIFYFSFILLRG